MGVEGGGGGWWRVGVEGGGGGWEWRWSLVVVAECGGD